MDPVRYRILGTTQASPPRRHGPSPLGGARSACPADRARAAGRPDRARRACWSTRCGAGDPPADAPGALQALVGRLRRALGADAVASAEGGYRLAAAPDDVDLHRFDRLAGEGLRALADGDPAKAAVVLDDALALWRGPALADLPDRTAEAARWETRRLDALRARHTAALALGQRPSSPCPSWPPCATTTPWTNPSRPCGCAPCATPAARAEALPLRGGTAPARRPARRRPGARSCGALHAELLAPAPAHARLRGRLPVTRAPAPRRPADPPRAPPAPGNLRARLTSFVGREADIEAIRADLAAARLVTLLGPRRRRQDPAVAGGRREASGTPRRTACGSPNSPPSTTPTPYREAVLTALGARETVLYGAGAEGMRGRRRPARATPSSGSSSTAAGAAC